MALAKATSEKNHLVARQTEGRLWIVDFLSLVDLSPSAQKFIFERMLFGVPDSPASEIQSVGDFVTRAGSLSSAIDAAIKAGDLAKNLWESDLADYFWSLNYCLLDTRRAIEKSRLVSSHGRMAGQEFCSLCWRLVNKFGLQNFSESKGYSAHYCAAHHPKLQTMAYHRARRGLLSAARRRANDTDLATLSDHEISTSAGKTNEEALDRLTKSFIPPIPTQALEILTKPVACWEDRAKQLLETIEIMAPDAYSQVSQVSLKQSANWGEWFLAVVSALDDSGADAQCWYDTEDFASPVSTEVESDTVGWRVLLKIFRRYQAVQIIASNPRPRGQKKGLVAKNSEIRTRLRRIVLNKQKQGLKIVWSQIAKELEVSRQRVSVLAKELGLR